MVACSHEEEEVLLLPLEWRGGKGEWEGDEGEEVRERGMER